MLSLGFMAFASPWILAALAALPILWWLLRITPPAPRLVRFPAIRLLFRLPEKEDTPAHTPWWLLLMRLLLVTFVILALAQPLLNPTNAWRNSGPVILVIDNGWSAAPNWDARRTAALDILEKAEREGRNVIMITTAAAAAGASLEPTKLLRAAEARTLFQAYAPQPWPSDLAAAVKALDKIESKDRGNIVWLSDGLDKKSTDAFAAKLVSMGDVVVLADQPRDLPVVIRAPTFSGENLVVRVERADKERPAVYWLRALAENGRVLVRRQVEFPAGQSSVEASFALPSEIRNAIARLDIERHASAAATLLLDERLRRRPVGLAAVATQSGTQPLLSDTYYLERALAPFSEVRRGPVAELLQRPLSVIFLPDSAPLSGEERAKISQWINNGGVLVRFAGPLLAQGEDDLLPVRIRRGDRTFGGAMSWSKPLALAPFDAASPFAGLSVTRDVLVQRQVLAEPSVDLNKKTWARLEDGTPLMTAERTGKGMLILMHTSSNAEWSNLPLAGLFVEMLQRVVNMSQGLAAADDGTRELLPPLETLDGLGRLGQAPPAAQAIAAADFAKIEVSPVHPPGYYGEKSNKRAFNLATSVRELKPMGDLPPGIDRGDYARGTETDLKPHLLTAALLLLILDLLISYVLRGLGWKRAADATVGMALVAVVALILAPAPQAGAESVDEFTRKASSETVLAYLITGEGETDRVSEAGLTGLRLILRARTSVEPIVMGVNPDLDELAFFPLIYWPITPGQKPPSAQAAAKLQTYLRSGGMIVFDIRDSQVGTGADTGDVRRVTQALKIPALVPVPENHVLTKAYYLLQRFPGRWVGGQTWVAQPEQTAFDGVSPIIIGTNDWAAAWAVDGNMRPLFPVVPGGEAQREQAFRSGVNIVMYALAGNYKADQVHIPTILKRLGQ
ncbi:MAG: DUF4159 domain-containing protein [Alphaproteobacteria bacterium]